MRGRQRPASGLPPCLLWLHAGRTAPQLTRLSLTRLGLATLPEQLRHLTALTRLVAQEGVGLGWSGRAFGWRGTEGARGGLCVWVCVCVCLAVC